MPPSIRTKRTRGIQVCAAGVGMGLERVPMHLAGAGVGGDGLTGNGRWLFLVICGTNLGMLFLVRRVCVQGVS